jgi:hypothetical protein
MAGTPSLRRSTAVRKHRFRRAPPPSLESGDQDNNEDCSMREENGLRLALRGRRRRVLHAAVLLASLASTAVFPAELDREQDKESVRTLLNAVALLKQEMAAREDALLKRIAELDIGQYLDPARLASLNDLREGRAQLGRYRALLEEQDRMLADVATRSHGLLVAMPEGELRERTLRLEVGQAERYRERRAALAQALRSNAGAMERLMEWAERNHAVVHVRGDNLAIDNQRSLDELNVLRAELDDSSRQVQEANRRFLLDVEKAAEVLPVLRQLADQ